MIIEPHMPTLRIWDGTQKGDILLAPQVRILQKALKIKVDGAFGPITEANVIAFQQSNGLLPDGVVGPYTWAKLAEKSVSVKRKLKNSTLAATIEEYLKYRDLVQAACRANQLREEVIFAIGWRESRWGLLLDQGLTGDYIKRAPAPHRPGNLPPDGLGFGRGLMQIDYDAHQFARTGKWRDPSANISYGCKVLRDMYVYFNKRKYDVYSRGTRDRMAIAAYNCGPRRVDQTIAYGRDIDFFTHGRDYSTNVLTVAAEFQQIIKDIK